MKRSLSLPARLSLGVMAVLVAVTVLADAMAVRELRLRLSASVADSLAGMVKRMAGQMDRDIATMRGLLSGEAELLKDRSATDMYDALSGEGSILDHVFDYGVIAIDAAGNVVADSRKRETWHGMSLADRDYFQRTFALGGSVVSRPFAASTPDHTPLVVLTAPLRDKSGRVSAMLAGGINLTSNRILAQPTGPQSSRYGQIGIFTLDGQVVAHSEKRLVLDIFENPLPELWDEDGGPQTLEVTTVDGERALLAAARLTEADWLVAGVFPSRELYRTVEEGFSAAHLWFAAGLAVSCLLVLLISRRTVRDLELLSREVAAIGEHGESAVEDRVGTGYRGEAGMLASSVNGMLDSLASAQRSIGELSARLAETEERERRDIAADLHDSVCQTLALANMRLGGALAACPDGKAKENLREVRVLLERSVAELKTLIFDLSPSILYELGLMPALEWYAGEFAQKFGIPVFVRGDVPSRVLDDERSIFLYRAAGELLTNAAKHARATALEVRLRCRDGIVAMTVEDDGSGMPEGWEEGGGFGLRSLRLRARRLGGGFQARAREEGGTAAEVCVAQAGTGE